MFKRFMLCVVVTMLVGSCKATGELSADELSVLLFSVVKTHTIGVVELLLVQDKTMRQNKRKRRHEEVKRLSLPLDVIKYVILPHDSNPDPRLIDMQNNNGEIALQTIPIQYVIRACQLNKRIKVSNLLKKFANDPEYK